MLIICQIFGIYVLADSHNNDNNYNTNVTCWYEPIYVKYILV